MPHNLDTDSPAVDDILVRLVGMYDEYEYATVESRRRAEKRRDYYDGDQWTADDAAVLRERNQPVVVSNRIAPKVNALLGNEIRNRYDPQAYPRTPQHQDDASIATDALRYVADAQDLDQVFSQGTEDMLIEGMCGLLVEPSIVRGADRAIESAEVLVRPLYWNRIFHDPFSRKGDFADARYTGLVDWFDYDDIRRDPKYQDESSQKVLEMTKADPGSGVGTDDAHQDVADSRFGYWFVTEGGRSRIKICEIYYLDSLLDVDGNPLDDGEEGWHVATFTRKGLLKAPRLVALRDDSDDGGKTYNPMALGSAYVAKDGERYGPVEGMISPQDEINKRRSKALHLASLRQMIAEAGAFPNITEARTEFTKPGGWVMVNDGAIVEGRFQIQNTADLSAQQFQLLQDAYAQIDTQGPQSAVPVDGGKISGRAYIAQQEQAALEFEPLFDNVRAWRLRAYRIIWWQIHQFWPFEKWFRVRDDQDKKGFRFVGINVRMTAAHRYQQLVDEDVPVAQAVDQSMGMEGSTALQQILQTLEAQAQQAQQLGAQIDPAMIEQAAIQQLLASPIGQAEFTASRVADLDMDIVLESVRHSAVIEHEEFQDILALQSSGQLQLPPAAILKASSLRNKNELISMVEEPPADPAAQQAQMAEQQAQLELLQASVQKLLADAALSQASAQRAEAQAAKAAAEAQAVPSSAQKDQAQAIKAAAEAGEITGTQPQLAMIGEEGSQL